MLGLFHLLQIRGDAECLDSVLGHEQNLEGWEPPENSHGPKIVVVEIQLFQFRAYLLVEYIIKILQFGIRKVENLDLFQKVAIEPALKDLIC